MPGNDLLLQTIEAVYASGIEGESVSAALEKTKRLLGAAGATLEVMDLVVRRHIEFWSVGAPTHAGDKYVSEFAAINPRVPYALRQLTGKVAWDYEILSEREMTRDPFYSEFLPSVGLRYCLGAVLERAPDKLATVTVHRTKKQGHVQQREIALMRRLSPHFQRAYDMRTRLKAADSRKGVLENTLAWLVDGVALMRADGNIVYANDTLRGLAARGDGFRLTHTIKFAEPEARRRLDCALAAVQKVGEHFFDGHATDFLAPRRGDLPAYIVSVRPLVCGQTRSTFHADAEIMLLLRDPLCRNVAVSQILQELFSLTNAEADLAQALCAGKTTTAYASERRVTLNTVYSHLKRIREKTGCKSVPGLIRKFAELDVPLRTNR